MGQVGRVGSFTGFPPEAFKFFAQLAKNNNRDWFHAHKDVYERARHEPMKALMAAVDPPFGTGWMSRINNDMRFNKDRAPYKTHTDASVKGHYVSVGPQGMYVGTGLYKPEPATLRQLREAIAADASGTKLQTIVTARCGAAGIPSRPTRRPSRRHAATTRTIRASSC